MAEAHHLIAAGDFVKSGGMDRANYALARHLADRGGRVELVAYRVADDLLALPGVTWHRVVKPLGSYTLAGPLMHRAALGHARRASAAGARVVVNGGNCPFGDANWVHHVNAAEPRGRAAGGMLRRLKDAVDRRAREAEERRAVPMARVVVTTCAQTQTDIIKHLNIDPSRIEVVDLGIDPTIFRPAGEGERLDTRRRLGWHPTRPVVVFVGGLGGPRKGFDTLLAAWSTLCRDPNWDATLAVVGTGPDLPRWRAEARPLGDKVAFLGRRDDFPAILRAADAFALPSRYEGYSMATKEALCCGLPALVTASAGIADKYPPSLQHLLIPDPDDPADLAARLRRWRAGPDADRVELASFGASLRSWTWGDMASRFAEVVSVRPMG